MSSDTGSGDIIQKSLSELNKLRHEASKVFLTASEGVRDLAGEETGKEKKFLAGLKTQIDSVTSALGSVEKSLSQPNSLPTALLLGSLDSDSNVETFHLYSTLSKSYKWLDKAHDFSAGAAVHLSKNSLKRSYGAVTRNRRRNPNSSQQVEPAYFNKKIDDMNKLFPDMKLTITRPGDTRLNAIVEVKLDRVLRGVVIFKGMMIEWVAVKGWEEELVKSDGHPDIWGESRYQVFQRITENANAAMLHFQSPIYPELAVQSFMTYLHSFSSLFSEKCKLCGCHLKDNLPPTWREFRTLEAFHQNCRPMQ